MYLNTGLDSCQPPQKRLPVFAVWRKKNTLSNIKVVVFNPPAPIRSKIRLIRKPLKKLSTSFP